MGQVFTLRNHPVNPAMLRTAKKILEMTEKGLLTSLIHIGCGPDGKSIMGLCGEFAEDLQFATEAASEGFSRLVGHKIEQQSSDVITLVPPRLRRKA